VQCTARPAGYGRDVDRVRPPESLIAHKLLHEPGIPSFSLLLADLKVGRRDRLRYYAFGLLYRDGFDLTDASLLDRKSLLQQAMSRLSPPGE
jgi:bifunctional non-homologous end joining protein LigD